jgi:hypothetical protein
MWVSLEAVSGRRGRRVIFHFNLSLADAVQDSGLQMVVCEWWFAAT